jgi:tetratricopeptide (TPR) repeat protein
MIRVSRSWVHAAALATLLLPACGASLRTHEAKTPLEVSKSGGNHGGGDGSEDARGGTHELQLEPLRIEVVPDAEGKLTATATDARTLFDEGNDALMQRQYDQALTAYERLVVDFPGSALVPAAFYNAGIAWEGKADFPQAADRYRRAVAAAPAGSKDGRDAAFRLGAVLAESKQFADSVATFEKLLDTDTLDAEDRLEGLARLGYALVELKDYTGAEEVLRQALAFHKDAAARGEISSNYFASMAQYYLAVIPHRQFRAVPLRYPEEQMGRDLEHKSELFMLAEERYTRLIEGYPNPYWTTAAIYQIGLMYKEFWDDFMAVPMPPDMTPAGGKEYVKLLNQNKDLRKLLEKSLYVHEKNVVHSREVGLQSVWVDASEVRAGEVKTIMARQQRGELIPPGTAAPAVIASGENEGAEPKSPEGASSSKDGAIDYVPGRREL